MRPATIAVQNGPTGLDAIGASAVPLYQTVSYAYRRAEDLAEAFRGTRPGYVYTRIANPTTAALEAKLAGLERGIGCIATSSGMAAIAAVVMGLVKMGDEIVAAAGIFGGTVSLFENVLGRFGVATRFVDATDPDRVAGAVTDRTRLIFVETIGNPRMAVPNLCAIAEAARDAGVPLVVDNTVATPVLIRPGQFGADIVVHSTSKFINGHGTALGGAIIDTGHYDWPVGPFSDIAERYQTSRQMAFLLHLREGIYRDLGGCPAPMNSFLMLQGLETLSVRMPIHCANAKRLAQFLEQHPDVSWVNYPGLESSPYYRRAMNQFGGHGGGLLTFSLGTKAGAFRFINALRLGKNLANLGEAKTLVIHPASTIFHEFDVEARERTGVTEDMIRVSVGLEDFEDIQEDFERAISESR
jgi:O-acetylhomoserine (thiol)-lyase